MFCQQNMKAYAFPWSQQQISRTLTLTEEGYGELFADGSGIARFQAMVLPRLAKLGRNASNKSGKLQILACQRAGNG